MSIDGLQNKPQNARHRRHTGIDGPQIGLENTWHSCDTGTEGHRSLKYLAQLARVADKRDLKTSGRRAQWPSEQSGADPPTQLAQRHNACLPANVEGLQSLNPQFAGTNVRQGERLAQIQLKTCKYRHTKRTP